MAEKIQLFRCKVHRTNVEPENANLPIKVNVIGGAHLGGKREFMPGQEVKLTLAQIGVLKTPVETEFVIPDSSGVYQEKNPIEAARSQFPDFNFKYNKVTGEIVAHKSTPNYFVEYLDGVPA